MSQLLTFEQTSKLIRFPNSVFHHLGRKSDKDDDVKKAVSASLGIVTADGHIAALAKGPNLDVVYLEVNEQLAAWTFAPLQDYIPQITCLVPFNQNKNFQRNSLILVGLNCGPESGAICLFDTSASKLIRYIVLPQPVTSLTVVAGAGDGPGPGTPGFLHAALRYLHGVVAVGMVQGAVYLLDLALDESLPASSDTEPAGIVFIDPCSKEISRCRNETLAHGNHMAIQLTEDDVTDRTFVWQDSPSEARSSPSQNLEYQFPSDEISVTCLNYNNYNATLAIGYNIGTWKLISLVTLQTDYSSIYSRSENTVTHISFQEPENDPRNYVYYWIVRSDTEESVQGLAVATLYSLTYRHKQQEYIGDELCPLYTDLELLIPRFEHVLGGEDSPNYSWCINMYTLQLDSSTCLEEDAQDASPLLDNGLNVIIWKAGVDYKTAATYLGIFDMNAWYQAQMPSLFSVDEGDDLCSYFSHSLLEDPDGQSGGILDVTVFRDSVARFTGAPGPILEQHCYPSSLKYDIVVLTKDGYLTATQLGIQRRVLAELSSKLSVLVQPTQMYQICLMTGLAGGNMEPSLLAQREVLMNIALEHNMVGLIVSAVFDWADGKYSKSGCSLKFVMDWALKRVATLKHKLDVTTVPLFDYSIGEADKTCLQLLNQISGEFSQILSILSSIEDASGPVTQLGLEQLEGRKIVTGLLLLYTQAITWFVNAGLLPEQPEGSRMNPYPVGYLIEMYRSRRRSMGQLPRTFGKPCLLVDLLCEDIGDDLIKCFQKSGGVGDYPPPSLHGLLSVFLAPASAPSKLRLVQYLFLDLAQVLNPELWSDLVDKLIKFPSAFSLPPSVIKLTQAFWLLDHEDFEESVAMLLDPLLRDDDVSPDHHRAILTALLCQGQHSLALKYTQLRRPPMLDHRDIQLHINVLLQNGSIQAAYTFQKSHQAYNGSSELLQQIFTKAEDLNKLESVLKLYLTKQEESQLVRFLQQSKKAGSQEVLMLYYLQRSRYTEAYQLNQNLRSRQVSTPAMDAIMDRYCSILPSIGPGSQLLLSKLPPFGGNKLQNKLPEAVSVKTPLPAGRGLINLTSRAARIQSQLATPKRQMPSETPFRSKTKSFLLSESSLESAKKRKLAERPTMEFPSEVHEKIAEQSVSRPSSGELVTPPGKRSRMAEDQSSLSMASKVDLNPSRFLQGEFRSLLETPTIVRKSVSRASESHFNLDQTSHTPHSILKVKNLIQENSPALDDSLNDYPAGSRGGSCGPISLHDTRHSHSRETTPNKSLRFKVPKKLPPTGGPPSALSMPSSEALTTIFSPSLRSPMAEMGTSSDAEISFQIPAHRVDQPQFSRLKVRNISESSRRSSEDDSFHSLERSRTSITDTPQDKPTKETTTTSPRFRMSDSLRASVEEAERQAKAVLNAADSTATDTVDDSATLDEDLTEEAAAPAAEIEKVVQDLDKDAEGSFQEQEESVNQQSSLDVSSELDVSDIPFEDETRTLFPELKEEKYMGDATLHEFMHNFEEELREGFRQGIQSNKEGENVIESEQPETAAAEKCRVGHLPEGLFGQVLDNTHTDLHTPDKSVHMTKKDLPNISTIFNVTASEEDVNSPQESLNTPDPYSAEKSVYEANRSLPNFSQIINVTTSEEDMNSPKIGLDTPDVEQVKSANPNQSLPNFSQIMDITAQSDDLEHQQELELSRAVETIPDSAVATTAAAADELILVEDNRKDDVISLLETSQEPENIIEEIKDDSNEIQESIVEEVVDRQAASDRVVELIVEKSTTSEVIEIVDNTKLDKSRKLSALVDSIAKKVSSSTFSYDSATSTITPIRRPTLSRTKELEETVIHENLEENIVQESVGEAIEIESDGDKEEIDAVEEIKDHEDTPKSTIVEIADTESCRDDILSNVSEKGSDMDDVISITDVPATPILETPEDNDDNLAPVQLEDLPTDDNLPATQLEDLPFQPKEDTLRDLLDQRAVDINKGDMREMLECISTTATRASSIAGSMWSEAPAETSFTEAGSLYSEVPCAANSADGSLSEAPGDEGDISAAVSADNSFSEAATDNAEAVPQEENIPVAASFIFAEAEVLDANNENINQSQQEFAMRSPTKTDFDIVEDMDYEESHIEQELTIQGEGTTKEATDVDNAIPETTAKPDETQVLEAPTAVTEKEPEVSSETPDKLDETQVLEAAPGVQESFGTPSGPRFTGVLSKQVPVTPGFPRMSAPKAAMAASFIAPDQALDFSVPTILETEDDENEVVDNPEDNFLFAQPHDCSIEDINEDDMETETEPSKTTEPEKQPDESMAIEIASENVEDTKKDTSKKAEKEMDKSKESEQVDEVDMNTPDVIVDQEEKVIEAVEELVAKDASNEKDSDNSLLIIGARRTRRRPSPRAARSTPQKSPSASATRSKLVDKTPTDAEQSPSTRSRSTTLSTKSQRGAARVVRAVIDEKRSSQKASTPSRTAIVELPRDTTPESKPTAETRSSRKSRNEETPQKDATPARSSSRKATSATPTRASARKAVAGESPTRYSSRKASTSGTPTKASATPTRASARKASASETPTRASARKASPTPTRASARKTSATPTRASTRKASTSETPTRVSARKASPTPTRASARKTSATPTRSSARKSSTSETPTRASARKASATPSRSSARKRSATPTNKTPSKKTDETLKATKTPEIVTESSKKSSNTPVRKSTRKSSVTPSSSALLRPASSRRKITRRSTIAVSVPVSATTPSTPSRRSKRLDVGTPNQDMDVATPTRSSRKSAKKQETVEETKAKHAKRNLNEQSPEDLVLQLPPGTPTRPSSRIDSASPSSTPGGRRSTRKNQATEEEQGPPCKGTPASAAKSSTKKSGNEPATENTPARRASRRLSGTPMNIVTAPDGGVITGSGRRGRTTPRAKQRHSAVRKEDVEKALGLTILEPVPEDLEVNKVSSLEDIPDDDQTGEKPKGRGRGRRSTVTVDASSVSSLAAPDNNLEAGGGSATEGGVSEAESETDSVKPKRGRPKRSIITLKRGEGLLFSEEGQTEEFEGPSLIEVLKSQMPKTKYVARKKRSTVRRLK